MAIDRTLVVGMLDFASRINKDGSVSTVCSDAKTMLDWYDLEIEKIRARHPLQRAQTLDSILGGVDGIGQNPKSS